MSFLCSTCATGFPTESIRRNHMHDQWHIYNLKRRMASLPPITPEQYNQTHETTPPVCDSAQSLDDVAHHDSTSVETLDDTLIATEDTDDDDDDALLDPTKCLFCTKSWPTVSDNLNHMSTSHGFAIPNLSSLQTDLETLISYLSLVLNKYNECFHCGHVKHSAEAVKAHMIAKGHCMLNLDEGSEYLDFWDESDGVGSDGDDGEDTERHPNTADSILLSQTEMRLPSGVVATSRHGESPIASRSRKARAAHKQIMALAAVDSSPQPETSTSDFSNASNRRQPTRALALRSSMGLTGLSSAQMHSLAIEQRKIDLSAFRARNKAQWTLEKLGNKVKQKHFKPDTPGRSNG